MQDEGKKPIRAKQWAVLPPYVASFPDGSHVPACPDCKTTKFVASLIEDSSAITSFVCCENGHSWSPTKLIDLHLNNALKAEEYSGKAAGEGLNLWIQEFITEASGSSDRAYAILIGAILDEFLNLMLSTFAINEGLIQDRMLEPDRPLGTFGSKIDACYLFGLISKNDRDSLRLFQKIRNAFAHELSNLSFDDGGISARIQTLTHGLAVEKEEDVTPRALFEICGNKIRTSLLTKISFIKRCAKMPDDPNGSLLERLMSSFQTDQNP